MYYDVHVCFFGKHKCIYIQYVMYPSHASLIKIISTEDQWPASQCVCTDPLHDHDSVLNTSDSSHSTKKLTEGKYNSYYMHTAPFMLKRSPDCCDASHNYTLKAARTTKRFTASSKSLNAWLTTFNVVVIYN